MITKSNTNHTVDLSKGIVSMTSALNTIIYDQLEHYLHWIQYSKTHILPQKVFPLFINMIEKQYTFPYFSILIFKVDPSVP